MGIQQRQKLSLADKNETWRKGNVNYYAESARFNNVYLLSLYKAASGRLEETDYTYITNPYNIQNRPELKNYPAKLKNYPIIPTIYNLLLGEKRNRPILKSVLVRNSDSANRKKAQEEVFFKKQLQQLYVNALNGLGLETGIESKDVPPLENSVQNFSKQWNDDRAVQGQEILDFIDDDLKIPQKFLKGFEHWLVTNSVYTIKDVVNDELTYRIVDPRNVGFIADDSVEFIENGEAAAITEVITVSEFIDRFYDLITDDLANYLDRVGSSGSSEKRLVFSDDLDGVRTTDSTSFSRENFGNTVEVTYVNWKSRLQIKQKVYKNFLGVEVREEVDNDYKADTTLGEKIVEVWVDEVWEGYRVDNKYYYGIQAVPFQRGTLQNPSKCKLLINGRIKRIGTMKALSMVELMMPFQHLYNFAHYRLNLILAKNKENMTLMPLSLIPTKEGWDMFSVMYYAEATGYLFVDDLALEPSKLQTALNAVKVIDASLNQFIQYMSQYLRDIKMEAMDLVGLTPERKGEQTAATQGLGVTEGAVYRSSLITEDFFAGYDEFQECEYAGFLDLSKFAYRNGKKGSYNTSDGRSLLLDVEVSKHIESEYGVIVISSAKEEEKRRTLQSYGMAFVQNNMRPGQVAKMLENNTSFTKLSAQLSEIDRYEQQLEQQKEQADRDNAMKIQQMKSTDLEEERKVKIYIADQTNLTSRENKLDDIEAKLYGMDANADGQDDGLALADSSIERDKLLNAASIAREGFQVKREELNTKKQIEKDKNSTALQIAKTNKNKYDK